MTSPSATAGAARALGALVAWTLVACTASSSQVAPPASDPYYPTGLALSPDERFLFVLSANSDLRYDSGTIQVLDVGELAAMAAEVAAGSAPAGCATDGSIPSAVACPSTTAEGAPAPFVIAGASVKLGNFGAAIAVQPLVRGDGMASSVLRLFATVRGDPSLTWADFDTAALTIDCGTTGTFARCSEAHRLDSVRNVIEFGAISEEPFYLAVDPVAGHVFVTHLRSGRVTLATAPLTEGSTPVLSDVLGGLFAPSNATGEVRAVGVAARRPGEAGGPVYVTSSSEGRIATIRVAEGPRLVPGPSFFLGELLGSGTPGDARGIVFSADGARAYVVNRLPSSLLVFDTSLSATGVPRNDFLGAVEVCTQPSMVAVGDLGQGARVFLPCFATGEVWIVDPERLELVAAADVGRGPNGIAVAPTRQLAFVANYAEDTNAVIDARPGSPTENHTVLRLGKQRFLEQP